MKMKNKKAEQIAAKKRHKEQLKASRKKAPGLERAAPSRTEKPTILIVCEGENTEPSYLRQFRLSTATIKPVGEGYNTVTLVRRAIALAQEDHYEQVWCVFDKDDFSANDFNSAITIAESNNFGVAYSNQAFEYWIILHFDDHQGGGMHRNDYHDRINALLRPFDVTFDGKGNKTISEGIFELLDAVDERSNKERKMLAIERAKRNHDRLDHRNPASEESSTTVFKLVEELLKYV